MKLLVGADPEIWIFDNKQGKIISAHGLFPGTKEEPFKVEHGAVQVDGMAAEYNILPASNVNEFVFYNLSVLCSLRDIIKERNPDLDFKFVFTPVADFGAEYIAEQPEEARRLGCTPDFNAYTDGQANPTPDADMPFRTASGHIHLGWTKDQDIADPEFIEACVMMSKQMDGYLGTVNVLMEHKLYADGDRRRELYGRAGAFRPKPYGVEYRTASNVWLTSTTYMQQAYTATKRAFDDLLGGYRWYEDWRGADHWINDYSKDLCHNGYFSPHVVYGTTILTMENLDGLRAMWGAKLDVDIVENLFEDDHDDFIVDDDDDNDWDDEPEDDGFVHAAPIGIVDALGEGF